MTTNLAQLRSTRVPKKLEKPRPLNQATLNQNRHSTIDDRMEFYDEILILIDQVVNNLSKRHYDRILKANIAQLDCVLRVYGPKLEAIFKDQLDRAFVTFRNACRDETLDYTSRFQLLKLIERRAMQWMVDEIGYYKQKAALIDLDGTAGAALENSFSSPAIFPQSPVMTSTPIIVPQQPILGPGELVKSSGKYPAPTKVLGKNYCKDEVVIRNADSGKVNPGAKERLVQITGPTEDKINFAKQLMEETIRRNASPVRSEIPEQELGSTSSLTSSASDDENMRSSKRSTLQYSLSSGDNTIGEYKYTVVVGDESIKIIGCNLDLVRISKLVLDEYFSPEGNEPVSEFVAEPSNRNSEESEDTFQDQQSLAKYDEIKTNAKTSSTPTSQGVKKYYYAVEELIYFVDSPLSRKIPPLWERVSKEYGAIMRQTPIEWYESATLLRNRPLEANSIIAITSSSDSLIESQE